jgi:hypothetical protein
MAKDRSLVIAVIGIVALAFLIGGIFGNPMTKLQKTIDNEMANGVVGSAAYVGYQQNPQWVQTCQSMYFPVMDKHCDSDSTDSWSYAACKATFDSYMDCAYERFNM